MTNPSSGEMISPNPTSPAFAQFTPESPALFHTLFAIPTPRIDPIRVCELDTGRPRDQVPRFQTTPAIRRARTITSRRDRAGVDEQINREQVHDTERNRRPEEQHRDERAAEVQQPGVDDRGRGRERAGVDDRGNGVGRVVEPVDELEREGDQQGDDQEDERAGRER